MAIHLRSQGVSLLESAEEAMDIARQAGVSLHISHLCALGQPNWTKRPRLLAMIDDGRAKGQDITFDQHPYSAASTLLNQVLPPWANAGGGAAMAGRLADPATRQRIRDEVTGVCQPQDPRGWENRALFMDWNDVFVSGARTPEVAGKTIARLGEEQGKEPVDALLDLLMQDRGEVTAIYFNLYNEEDIATIMRHPGHMVGSDGVISSGLPHPRQYGSFPRVLGKYCRQEKVLDLSTAVHRMTGATAQRLGLADRGIIRVGMKADITIFDPGAVADTATYPNPRQYPVGIPHVVVNGVPIVRDGQMTGAQPGKALTA
jgi:N-acyl-D-aspartate/D-glutamate deacylase